MQAKTVFLTLLTLAATSYAENTIPSQRRSVESMIRAERFQSESRASTNEYRSWKISLIPMLASQTLDITSSYGMRELNPLLAGPDGQFGAKAAGIKLGTTAALLGVEYLIIKAHPGAARVFSKLNWSGSAVTSALAVHNYSIR